MHTEQKKGRTFFLLSFFKAMSQSKNERAVKTTSWGATCDSFRHHDMSKHAYGSEQVKIAGIETCKGKKSGYIGPYRTIQ